jgi:hypothetical protein
MPITVELASDQGRRTEIPDFDDFADALMEQWQPSQSQSINERRAQTEDPATLRLARSF